MFLQINYLFKNIVFFEMELDLTFELCYNALVLNKKNIFYFSNYCSNEEFKEWLEMNHKTILPKDFELIDKHKQNIILSVKEKYIYDKFLKYRKDIINTIPKQYSNNYMMCCKMRRYVLKELYNFYIDNKYYINIIKNNNLFINNIYIFINNKIEELKTIYD